MEELIEENTVTWVPGKYSGNDIKGMVDRSHVEEMRSHQGRPYLRLLSISNGGKIDFNTQLEDSCLRRPEACPNGMTVAFWARFHTNSRDGKRFVAFTNNNGDDPGFSARINGQLNRIDIKVSS